MTSYQTVLTPEEAEVMALHALAWVASDDRLGPRLLALTGLDASTLRARAGSAEILGATLDFLAAHEADFIACAEAIGTEPARLASARGMLGQ
ncbi:DUF3572 domain-containing protein [Sphingosinicella microcystinivorans]|uniref:Uncharacterized protein DUF3572 n=2 Tax=Sphingosinicella microcystinivorans TaxID=335406 RepID=A0ABX9T1S3_SPHMI|nr:DUF3572 domain-containing protein [Sphingosinicella microcystinivorans]RKS91296.1 uncharacterized protein DUF3572 [Sphingosinicella microcystinivorans]